MSSFININERYGRKNEFRPVPLTRGKGPCLIYKLSTLWHPNGRGKYLRVSGRIIYRDVRKRDSGVSISDVFVPRTSFVVTIYVRAKSVNGIVITGFFFIIYSLLQYRSSSSNLVATYINHTTAMGYGTFDGRRALEIR